MTIEKRILSILLILVMAVSLVPAFGVEVWATYETTTGVKYIDDNGIAQTTSGDVSVIQGEDASNRATWNAGWYVVSGAAVLSKGAEVSGNVHLILADDASLTINNVDDNKAGIMVSGAGNSL